MRSDVKGWAVSDSFLWANVEEIAGQWCFCNEVDKQKAEENQKVKPKHS